MVGDHSGHPPEGASHFTPLWGTLRGNSQPAPSGPGLRVVSSESGGIPPHILHLRARVSQARGLCVTAFDSHRGRPGTRILYPERGPESKHIRRSPLTGVAVCRDTRRCPGRHVLGTALPARVRAESRIPDVPMPPLGWGPPLISEYPFLRDPMASAGEADAAAAMAVDSRHGGSDDVLGPEEEIDVFLANLLSASWPAPAVVDDQFRWFPWKPPRAFARRAALRGDRWPLVDARLDKHPCFLWNALCRPRDPGHGLPFHPAEGGLASLIGFEPLGKPGASSRCG